MELRKSEQISSGFDKRAKCFDASAEIEVSIKACGFVARQTLFGKMYRIFIVMTHWLASCDRNASGCAFTPQRQLDLFHCDHIARWSARSGTTGHSGTGVNTGARLRSGCVPVPKLWFEHGLRETTKWTTHSLRCNAHAEVAEMRVQNIIESHDMVT